MKNLKRALSLVLSAAMMVGMMAVGTSAAKFSDVDSSDNLEAIELMAMIGVMEGTGDDTFEPDRLVTRNEMAVVICNLMDLKLNGFHNFTDVPEWADKYVGAMYINGLTSGTSATTYGGAANVTTTEAALMIMKTLGYFEYQVEFEDDWQLATIKRATLLNLFEDIDAGVKDALTRGEVAQMVMNALTQQLVVARDNSSNIVVNGNGTNVSITDSDYGYEYVKETDGTAYLLMEKLYDGKLTANGSEADDFLRPATKWTYTGNGKVETIKAADEPALVLTAETSEDDMTKILKDYNKNSQIDVHVDGVTVATDIAKGGVYAYTANGRTVEIYVDEDGATITDVVAINEYADKVYSVTKADDKTGAKRYVTVDNKKFETEDFAKKDRVVYTVANGEIKSMKAAEFVEGDITGIIYDGAKIKSVKIDGVSYKYNPCYSGSVVKLGDEVKMVLDTNGNLLMADNVTAAAPSVEEYVIVTAKGKDGFEAEQIKVLKIDGTTEIVAFEQYKDEENPLNNSLASVTKDTMYTMEDADNDGKYEFYNYETSKINDKYAGFDAVITSGSLNAKDDNLSNGWNIADEAVVFSYNATKAEWSVTTGAKLAAADAATITVAYANKDASGFYAAELVCVTSTMSSSSDVLYGYVTADVEDVKNDDNVTVDSVTFWNGEETVTALTNKANANKLAKNTFFTYKVNGDGELTDIKADMTSAAVTAYNGEKIAFADADMNAIGTYELDDEIVVIYVDVDEKVGIEDGSIEIADKNDAETKYILNVKYALDTEGKKVVAMFVDVLNNIDGVEL